MTMRLKNGIPLLYFNSKVSMAAIWFRECGDSVDKYFGPCGLSHMLEHIYVPSTDKYFTNGVTFSSSVSFLTYSHTTSVEELSKYLVTWFFDGHKVKDLISKHNIQDRISELDNETYIKELQYGDSISITDSIRSKKLVLFSKFDESYKVDDIRKGLHGLFNYMMDPDRIIIAIAGPKDLRRDVQSTFADNFGKLVSKPIELMYKEHHLNGTLSKLDDDDVLLINYKNRRYVETSIIIPVPKDSVLLSQELNVSPLECKYGSIGVVNHHMDILPTRQHFVEIRVYHKTVDHQMKYRDVFRKLLMQLDVSNLKSDDEHNLDSLIMLPPTYSSNNGHLTNKSFPKEIYFVFVTNTPMESSDIALQVKTIKMNNIATPPVRDETLSRVLPNNLRRSRGEHLCLINLLRDAASVRKRREDYNNIYFPMNYPNIVSAILLQTIYPQYFHVEHNIIKTPLDYSYMNYFSVILRDELDRSLLPTFMMNLRTYSIMEHIFDYDVAIYTFLNAQYFQPSFSLQKIYYTPTKPIFKNDLFVCAWPFNYFIHVLDYEPGSYSDIIRKIYKSSGLIYQGDMNFYGPYTVIRGIMN